MMMKPKRSKLRYFCLSLGLRKTANILEPSRGGIGIKLKTIKIKLM